jgi:hypothetical protein
MLSLYASQQLSVKDDKTTLEYTLFKDDKNPNLFYVLPNNPTFIMDGNKPRFLFIKYRGDVSEATAKDKGGFCVFSVNLDSSKLDDPALKTQAVSKLLDPNSRIVKVMKELAVDTLKMCVATVDNIDQEEYEALRQKLGYSPQEAAALVKEYKDGKKTTAKDFEILPEPDKIEFSPVTFASSEAELNLKDLGKTLIERVINPASPNLLGNHSTVFTVELSVQGAALFEQTMKEGQAGSVAVIYSPKFEARLPPATVTVTYASTESAQYTQTLSHDTWGNEDAIDKKRNEFLTDKSQVDVDMGSILGMGEGEAGQAEAAKLRTRLEDWGKKQLQEILSSKLTIDTTTLTEGQDQVNHFSNQLLAVSDFTRVWSESTSILYATTLSMQLPTIQSILAPGDSLDNYFKEINTLDPFFQDLELQVSVNTNYEQLGIFSCEVKLYYGRGIAGIKQDIETGKIDKDEKSGELKDFDPTRYNLTVKAISFNKSAEAISDKIAWPKEKDRNGVGINEYIYSYKINYKDSNIQYESPYYYKDSPVLTVSVVDEVLQVEADGSNLIQWEIVNSVLFEFEYEDQAQGVSTQRYSYQLNSKSQETKVVFKPKPIGAKRTQNIKYKSTFYLKDGQQITVPKTGWTPYNQTGKMVIPIDDPFTSMTQYTFIPKMGEIIDFIGITATYAATAIDFQMSKAFNFTEEESQTWSVPVVQQNNNNIGHMTYKGEMREQGQMKKISGDELNANTVFVGPQNITSIVFSPTQIDFDKYDAVSLYVKYKDQTGSYDFTAANEPVYKFTAVTDQRNDKFQYRLELIHSGDTIYIPGTNTNDWTETPGGKTIKLFLIIKAHLAKTGL